MLSMLIVKHGIKRCLQTWVASRGGDSVLESNHRSGQCSEYPLDISIAQIVEENRLAAE